MMQWSRRTFLQHAGVGSALLVCRISVAGTEANRAIGVGLIGCGGRGMGVAAAMGGIRAVCDPDRDRLASAAKKFQMDSAHAVTDFRRVLDDPGIEAVIIATPDHWHAPAAILACQAGKHVYVEKPAAHNLRESRLLLAAARRHGRVVQHGTQSRSDPLVVQAIGLLREKIIGEVLVARAWNVQFRPGIGHGKPSDPPAAVDYDAWVGPAEMVPYQANRFHYAWHWWYNFGTGDMGNDGVHELDYARWGLGVDRFPARVAGLGGKYFHQDDQEFPDTSHVLFEWPGEGDAPPRQLVYEMRLWSAASPYGLDNGVEFYGTKGRMVLSKRGKLEVFGDRNQPVEIPSTPQPVLQSHQADFLDAIRTGRRPAADIEEAHRSVALVHLGNASVRLGRSLAIDPAGETVVGDDEAASLLRRAYRQGGHWAIPSDA